MSVASFTGSARPQPGEPGNAARVSVCSRDQCICCNYIFFICAYSFYLYSISHPDKNGVPTIDLTKDSDCKVNTTGVTETQLAIERVIRKVFAHYSIPLEVSDPIRNSFKCKLWRMGKALSSMGGTKRKLTLERWKEGKLSTWSLTIHSREAHRQLLKRTHQVEIQLEEQVSKRQKLESEAKFLKLEVKSLKCIQAKQATQIIRLKAGRPENHRGYSSKSWQSYSRQHQAV